MCVAFSKVKEWCLVRKWGLILKHMFLFQNSYIKILLDELYKNNNKIKKYFLLVSAHGLSKEFQYHTSEFNFGFTEFL